MRRLRLQALSSWFSRLASKRKATASLGADSASFRLVRDVRSELEGNLPKVESHFLAIGEGLDSLGTHCQAMLDQCTQLKDLAGGKTATGSSMV